jgi:hypothetical protein
MVYLDKKIFISRKKHSLTLKEKIAVILLIITMVAIGFFRDFLFVHINAQIWLKYYNTADEHYSIPEVLKFLEKFSYNTLYYLKWPLTICFTLFYLGISISVVKLIFKQKKYVMTTVVVFAAITIIAGLFYTGGLILGNIEKGYELSRAFMGFVQSPFVLMILIPYFIFTDKSEK